MKKLMLSTALVAATSAAALAQTAAAEMFRAAAQPTEIRASEFIGKRVYASTTAVGAEADGPQAGWEDIGEIDDVILTRAGEVSSVLVDVGGFLGVGERQVAIDMGALRFVADSATAEDDADYFLVMNAARSDLEAAPAWEWRTGAATGAEGTPAMPGTPEAMAEGLATTDAAPAAGADDAAAGAEAVQGGGATVAGTPVAREGFVLAGPEVLTAERLTGAAVYDVEDRRIGSVSDLIVGADDVLTDAVVDVGGFLGIGAKPVAIPMGELSILHRADGDEIRIYVPMTRDALEAMPRFEG
ncbi:MAG: PRC-barrel domain-containing protein [Rhodobacteraceae bacterium]|nr:PRC-barrel domain-containing protein [Paracoccaceae bacterium]